jgi:Ca2+/Na+ antiporter
MVTSIPEIITIITLLKIGDVDAAVSDVLGSNIFSCLIIGVEELISGKDVGVATTN